MMRPWRVQYSSDGQSFIEETPDNVDDEGRLVAHLFELDEPGRDRRLADLIVSAVNARQAAGVDVAKLRALLAAATPGPWTRGHNPEHYDPLAYFAEAYRYGTPGTIHLVCVPVEGKDINDEALFTAITGNGPTSEANAALIAAAVNALPGLLDRIEELEAQLRRTA